MVEDLFLVVVVVDVRLFRCGAEGFLRSVARVDLRSGTATLEDDLRALTDRRCWAGVEDTGLKDRPTELLVLGDSTAVLSRMVFSSTASSSCTNDMAPSSSTSMSDSII